MNRMSWTSALTILVVVCLPSPVWSRTWTDSTGTYKIEGEFVKLAGGSVDIRRDDGKLVRVPLEKLSAADQQYVRDTQQRGEQSPFAEMQDANASGQSPAVAPGGVADVQTVVAEGVGRNRNAALKDAFRAAVQQVVGTVVDAETLVKNDELIKDQVLTYSDAYVPRHEIVAEGAEDGLYRMKIKAQVRRRSLIVKLRSANITVREIDGQSLFGNAISQLEAEKDAAALMRKALEGFPANCVQAQPVGEPQVVSKEEAQCTVEVQVDVQVDKDAYRAFSGRLGNTLQAIAKEKGEFSSRFTLADRGGEASATDAGFKYFWINGFLEGILADWMPKAFAAPHPIAPKFRRDAITVALATRVNQLYDRAEWEYYVIDKSLQPTLAELALTPGTGKLSLLDVNDQPIVVDRFRLAERVPHSPERYDALPIAAVGDKVGHVYILNNLSEDKPNCFIFLVSPFFIQHGTNQVQHKPAITVRRRIVLTHDELKASRKARCEIAFDPSTLVKDD